MPQYETDLDHTPMYIHFGRHFLHNSECGRLETKRLDAFKYGL